MGFRDELTSLSATVGIDPPGPAGHSGVLAAYCEDLGGVLSAVEAGWDDDDSEAKKAAAKEMRALAARMATRDDGLGTHRPSRARPRAERASAAPKTGAAPTTTSAQRHHDRAAVRRQSARNSR